MSLRSGKHLFEGLKDSISHQMYNDPSRIPTAEDNHFATRNGVKCAGVHLIVDIHGANKTRLNDLGHVERTLMDCVDVSDATLLHIHVHPFEPEGLSGVAVLAESHISIHTWPTTGYAAVDIFMCGNTKPDACISILKAAFDTTHITVYEFLRGQV